MSTDYVLSLTASERTRYRNMAATARRDENEMWAAAGIVAGATVADIGCGPGAVSAELADIVGPTGEVVAVDQDDNALSAARETMAERGFDNVVVLHGDAERSTIAPQTCDAVMIRHVLAHNGGREQPIVEHAASLLRPSGSLIVVDVDLTAQRFVPADPDLVDLQRRYVQLHRARGNDPLIGLRLAELLSGAGLEVVDHRGRYSIIDAVPGLRPPAWVARDAIVAAGLATDADVERWSRTLDQTEQQSRRTTIFVSTFTATGVAES